jgi:DNA-binding IclR family transcriptional regulator
MTDDVSPVRTVDRAIDVLLALEDGPRSLARIATRTGLAKPTTHRLLGTLSQRQLVIQDPATSEYMLGPGCLGIADAVLRGLGGLGILAQETMTALAESSQETVALYVAAGTQRVCVGQAPSPQPIRYTASVGVPKPIYTGAMGKLLLTFMNPESRREVLARTTLQQITPATVTDRSELDAELTRIRRVGYAISRGEQADGVAAISVPILAPAGHLVAALSILGPSDRMTDRVMTRIRPLLVEAADEISRTLGEPAPAEARTRERTRTR